MPSNIDLVRDHNDFYTYGVNSWNPCHVEMNTDLEYYLGRQFTDEDIADLADEGRNAYVYNYCQRNVHLMLGHQMLNRKGFGVQAVEGSDETTADIFDKCMYVAADYGDYYNIMTDCFEDEIITGMGWCSMWLDYSDDIVSGDLRLRADPFQTIIMDPKFTQPNLEDCGWILRRNFVNEEELKELQPGIKPKNYKSGVPDQKFNYMSLAQNNSGQTIWAYDEMWQRTTKKTPVVIDRRTGEARRWIGSQEDLDKKLLMEPWKMVIKLPMPSVKYTTFVGMEYVYHGDDLLGIDDYPFTPFLGIYKPQYNDFKYKMHGVVRPTRDPQDNYNKIRSKEDDLLRSALYSSWLIEEGALENAQDAFKAGTGQVIIRKKGYSRDAIEQLQHRDLPQGLPFLADQCNKDILQLPGFNEESLGIAEQGNTEISARLGQQRASNSVVTLQKYFNNHDISQKIVGKKLLRAIQVNYSAEKIKRMTGVDQLTPEFRDRDFGKYDCVVKNRQLTDTQRQHTFNQAVAVKEILGEEFPSSIIIDTLPMSNITEVRQKFEELQQQRQQMQQGLAEQEEINKRLINAEIVHKLSLAEQQRETAVSRQALAIQHLANSDADRAKANLDNVKAVKEIEGMKMDQLIKGLTFLLSMQEQARLTQKSDAKETSRQSEEDMLATNEMNRTGGSEAESQGKLSALAQANPGA